MNVKNENQEMVTITLPANHALLRHIEDIQRALTQRNARIAELEGIINGTGESEQLARAREDGFRDGWKSSWYETADAVKEAQASLDCLREASWKNYLSRYL